MQVAKVHGSEGRTFVGEGFQPSSSALVRIADIGHVRTSNARTSPVRSGYRFISERAPVLHYTRTQLAFVAIVFSNARRGMRAIESTTEW
jgi:hypothetical protein